MHSSPLLSQPPGSTGPCGGAQWLPAAKETCRRVRKWRNAERRGQPRPAALPPPVPERSAVQCRAVLCSAVLCCASPRRAVSAAPRRPQPSRSPSTAPDESAGPAACLPACLPPSLPPGAPDRRPQPRPGTPAPSSPPRVPQLHRLHSAAGRPLPARFSHSSIAAPRRFRPPPEVAAPHSPARPGMESAGDLRRAGNEEFRRGQYGAAAELYSRALAVLEDAGTAGPGGAGPGSPHRTAPHRCVPRRGSRRRGAQRAAGQPRRLPAAGRRLPGLRRRLLQVSASSWAPLRRKIDRSPGADGH